MDKIKQYRYKYLESFNYEYGASSRCKDCTHSPFLVWSNHGSRCFQPSPGGRTESSCGARWNGPLGPHPQTHAQSYSSQSPCNNQIHVITNTLTNQSSMLNSCDTRTSNCKSMKICSTNSISVKIDYAEGLQTLNHTPIEILKIRITCYNEI